MNRDEGSYTLSQMYDRILVTSHHYCGKNRKKNCEQLFLAKVSDRDRNVKVNKVSLCY